MIYYYDVDLMSLKRLKTPQRMDRPANENVRMIRAYEDIGARPSGVDEFTIIVGNKDYWYCI
jgi:hypothetical protein